MENGRLRERIFAEVPYSTVMFLLWWPDNSGDPNVREDEDRSSHVLVNGVGGKQGNGLLGKDI